MTRFDRRLLEQAWDVDEPPNDFAERVVSRTLDQKREAGSAPKRSRIRARAVIVGGFALAAAAALIFWWRTEMAFASGERFASARSEVELGRRAVAVLEAGAHVRWDGPRVDQDRGDVFYRVEPGRTFVVKTPVGEVAVLGTCFRVRVAPAETGGSDVKRKEVMLAAGGAALGALVVVTVYEGRVQLSHAKEKLELKAGESGKLGANGAQKVEGGELAEAENALSDANRGAIASANDNLASDIVDLNRKLKNIEKEKSKLQDQLKSAELELAKRSDGGLPRNRSDFDLDQTDWAELAKDGTVKFRMPCMRPTGWKAGPEQLNELGLSPDDEEPIRAAYQRSYERVWKTLRPLCVKAVGNEQVVDVLGPDTCIHVIVDVARKQDKDAANEAMRLLGEVRAGQKPPPPPGTPTNPTFDVFWTMTGEQGKFEADLAQTFGPEEAHRLAYADKMCAGHSTFGGPGPRGVPGDPGPRGGK